MLSLSLNYPILQEKPWLFVMCFAVTLVVSLSLFLLSRWRRWAAFVAVLLAALWIVLLLPDFQYYFEIRDATADSIIEPFYRPHYILGYILVFLPVPFVLSGLMLRRTRNI
jgi:hypothetical protein